MGSLNDQILGNIYLETFILCVFAFSPLFAVQLHLVPIVLQMVGLTIDVHSQVCFSQLKLCLLKLLLCRKRAIVSNSLVLDSSALFIFSDEGLS